MTQTDILIVGAGPTGLTVATLLARHGVNFRIIDKSTAPTDQSRALGVQARTLELWDKVGLADAAIAEGMPLNALHLLTKRTVAQQGSGKPFLVLGDAGQAFTPYPFLLILEQNKIERMLLADLTAQLASTTEAVERNTEIIALTQDANAVHITLRHGDGREEMLATRWLIAADGAHSFVRRALNLGFAGATYPEALFVADIEMSWPLVRDKFYVEIPQQGLLAFFPMRGAGYSQERYRLLGRIPTELENKATITQADLQQLLDHHSVVAGKITATHWVSTYRIHKRMVENFRAGRVFLAGDAAHIHSPAGGQGMNTGIQDGWNLAWKLALVVRGEAHPVLLESYAPERMPVARAILNGTDRGFSFIASKNRFVHWLRSLAIPLLTNFTSHRSVGARIFRLVSQTWITYRDSAAVAGERVTAVAQPGDRAPYARFDTGPDAGRTIFTLLRGVDHHLLYFAGDAADGGKAEVQQRVQALLATYKFPIHLHTIQRDQRSLHKAYAVQTPTLFLIRPDGHIAWRGPVQKLDDLRAYLGRFFIG